VGYKKSVFSLPTGS